MDNSWLPKVTFCYVELLSLIYNSIDLMMLSGAGVQVRLETSLHFNHMGYSFILLLYIKERKEIKENKRKQTEKNIKQKIPACLYSLISLSFSDLE